MKYTLNKSKNKPKTKNEKENTHTSGHRVLLTKPSSILSKSSSKSPSMSSAISDIIKTHEVHKRN